MVPINSSNIEAVDYDEQQHILTIVFHRGSTYLYYDVPKKVYVELLEAPSQGTYHKNNIKYSYKYKRIY